MSWGTVALLMLGCAALGAVLGTTPPRLRTGWLVVAAAIAAFFVFLPGTCATAIASSAPFGEPELLQGHTSCWFLYGPAVPELGPLDAEVTSRLLQLTAAILAVTGLFVVRRHRRWHSDASG